MPTGPELLQAIQEERADPPSGIATLGLDGTHRWLERLEPGRALFHWDVDDAYMNLEGAVICSWIAAIGDQALFFASTSLCGENEGTRMAEFHVQLMENITGGTVTLDASIHRRTAERMFGECRFLDPDGSMMASMTATIDIIPAP